MPLVSLLLLTGCGSENTTTTNATESKQNIKTSPESELSLTENSKLPADAPVLRVAIEKDAYPPFEFQDEYGKYIGYDFDLIKAIGEEAGFKVEMDPRPFSEVLSSVEEGENDLAISALTVSEKRLENFSATNPYIKSFSSFVVKEESDLKEQSQLIGKRVSAQNSGFQYNLLDKTSKYQLKGVKTNYLAFESLFNGEADALFADRNMLFFLGKQFPEHPLVFIPYGEQIELAIFTKQGNTPVLSKLNDGLDKVKQSGKYQELNKKWFGSHALDVSVN